MGNRVSARWLMDKHPLFTKNVLGTSIYEFTPEKIYLLPANWSCGRHDSTKISQENIFYRFFYIILFEQIFRGSAAYESQVSTVR